MPTSRVDFSMYHDVAIFETTVYSRSLVIVTYVIAVQWCTHVYVR